MSNSKKKYIFAIDHGTSGPKCAIVSTTGQVMDWIFKEVPLYLPEPGAAEQDPNDWWNAIIAAGKELIDKGTVPVEDIVGVCNTSQWSGTVAVDKNGNHLMNAVIWMDTRGAPYAERIHKGWPKVSGYNLFKILKWLKITGGGPTLSGKDSIAHILWIKGERPDIYNKTYMFLEPQDYINQRLTGKFAASYSSIVMHWVTDNRDINNVKYHNKLIKMLKIDPDKLPKDLKWSSEILGPIKNEVADKIGLDKGTKVVMGAPDLQAACIGSGAVRDYEGHISIGTSDWILCHTPYKKTDIVHNMASVPSAIKGRYMLINEQEIAGGALSFLRDNVLYFKDELLKEESVPDVYKIFDRIVEKTPAGAHNLIFTPWLFGERCPVDDHSIRGGLYNISLDMTREHLIRAIFEGVAYNVRWAFMAVENFVKKWVKKENPSQIQDGKIMPELNIIGGGAQSNVWCQIFADVLDRKIKQVKDPIQANARGAAFIASVGLGYLKWDEIHKHIEIANVFTPNPENREIYDKLFKEFVNIYDITKKLYRRLNK